MLETKSARPIPDPLVKYRIELKPKAEKDLKGLPYEEFLQMQAEIEDYEDLKTLLDEKAISHSEPTRSLDAVIKDIGS